MDGLESGEVEGYRVGVSGCELLALRTGTKWTAQSVYWDEGR